MDFVESLYSLMIEDGTWIMHHDQEAQIVAFTSEINLIKSQTGTKKNTSKKIEKKEKTFVGDGKNAKNRDNNNDKNRPKIIYAD